MNSPSLLRIGATLFALGLLSTPLCAQDDTFKKVVAPFLKQHCTACHGAEKRESELRLDQLDGLKADNRNLWTMIHQRIATGDMPPKDHPQPTAMEKAELLGWIAKTQKALGSGSTRRLNRREQAAALRDITGLDVDFAAALPGDGTTAGFDTGAEGLQDAADSVAQWMRTTRRAVDGLRFLEPSAGKIIAADFREVKESKKVLETWKTYGVTAKSLGNTKLGMGLLIEPRAPGDREALTFAVPPPFDKQGVLRLKLVVSAMKPAEFKVPHPHFWVEVGGKDLDFREITGTLDKPQELIYEVQLGDLAITNKGVTISLSNKVEIPYSVEGFENEDRSRADQPPIPGGTGLFRPVFDRKLPFEKQPAPYIVLQRIEIEPSYVAAWPPAEWKAEVGEAKDTPEYAGKLLGLWIERAWRRPASDAERSPFAKLYQKLRAEGMTFDHALRAAFQSVLMSAPFRFLPSSAHKDAAISQHAIASRLSFMLWCEPPDAELRKLAAAGKLRDPAILDVQLDRLLADPRSRAFVRPFVFQWLEMEQPITIAQEHINKQDFRWGRYRKASMKDETVAYIAQLLIDNRPAKELIASDWTMMNDTLALHYGYKDIDGGELRKVKLLADDPRGGGILGHAGIQSMLCWMGDNWVIYRGAWVLRHVLDHPPPPPPLEVPELNPSDGKNKGKPFRELLKIHQEDMRCAVCHKTIDPAGFALQNFDISGRWRDVEHESYARGELDGKISWKGVGVTRPVDTAGRLPRGEEFKTFADFKQLIATHYQADMVRGMMKNLMIYASGRKPDVEDTKEIAAIMKVAESKGYPLRDLLKAVVKSKAFLEE
jgi:hypothetical protein